MRRTGNSQLLLRLEERTDWVTGHYLERGVVQIGRLRIYIYEGGMTLKYEEPAI